MLTIFSNPLAIAVALLAVAVVILIVALVRMHAKLKRFLVGFDSANMSDSLAHVSGKLAELQAFRDEIESYLEHVEKRLKKSIQSVHTVRFNPFKGTGGGGNQSFATTLLTEDGDGVIISSLYSREHVSVFAKPVRNRATEHELSDEERESLEKALNKLGL